MSDALGYYFRFGLGFLVASGGLYYAGGSWWAGVSLFAAAILVGWSFLARYEVYSSSCPQCDYENKVWPWSI